MSSIAAPSRTEAGPRERPAAKSDSVVAALRTGFGALILTALLVTFSPFQPLSPATADSGNLVNQLGYGLLGALALLGHVLFTDRATAFALLRPTWLVVAGWMLFSVTQSNWPDASLRAVLFSLFAMCAATGAICLPPTAKAFRASLVFAALAVLGLSYLGLVLWPDAAIHGATGDEPEHAGLWRGIYSHKNVAGPVMAALFFAGLYLVRSGTKRAGWLVLVLSALFVLKTGSKTSAGLVPLVALLVIGGRASGGRSLPCLILAAAVAAMAALTLGAAISPLLNDAVQFVLPGTTFTGRMDLWRYALDLMQPRQWTGWGFESFWTTPIVTDAERPFELSWDPGGAVNSHSGYLDVAIALGWPALIPVAAMLLVLPMADYMRCREGEESQRLADFFLMVLGFMLLNSFLESYLLKRNDPTWMLTFLSVVGLRLLARFRVVSGDEAATLQLKPAGAALP
ncbi:O-antigen ligase family protein [Aureimonas leprariae]|uniref:O-antigen ligase family protein n=1 Tax=Plantimonas leprariae TaxID=2615207 RepID=A0A7V7TWU1_9HYPH|nr:O-antigen ligase [Aureimonas leprariae]KAB0680383.1 O-antigen ligase family protein [Aureimonas leprariae]